MGADLIVTAGQKAVELFGGQLVAFDYFIMGCIVGVTALFLKYILKAEEGQYTWVKIVMPIVLGVIIYIVGGLIQGTAILDSLKIGLIVGLGSMGFYDVIKKVFKTKGSSSAKEIGDAIHEEIKKNV